VLRSGWVSPPRLLDFYGAGEDNGGRGTDSPGGRHPNRTNCAPTPTTPKVSYRPDALPAAQPTASKHLRLEVLRNPENTLP